MNKVQFIGNVGADPEVRRLPSGDPVVNLRIATSDRWKDKQTGERKEKTEWHTVVIFNTNIAKVAEQYVKKGSRIYVEGAMRHRKWTDREGVERYSTEVVLENFRGEIELLDRAERAERSPDSYGTTTSREDGAGARGGSGAPTGRGGYELDDDIPF